MRRILIALLALATLPLIAQNLPLTVDTIMRGPQFAGYAPRSLRWSLDGKAVYFEWKQYTDPVEENFDTYVVGRDGKGLRKLTDEEAKHAAPVRGHYTRDRRRVVSISGGDVVLHEAGASRRRQLTKTTAIESDPRFTRDERHVAFVRGNNLYVLSLEDGTEVQRTNIVEADEKGPHVALFEDENKDRTESQKWVAEEAKKLSDVLARRSAERKE